MIALGFAGPGLVGLSLCRPLVPVDGADFSQLAGGLAAGRPIAVTQLGLLVLVATPVVRVTASVIGFALERDHLYAAITLAVLAILLTSLFVIR